VVGHATLEARATDGRIRDQSQNPHWALGSEPPLLKSHVDAPDMVRCQMNFRHMSFTDIKFDIEICLDIKIDIKHSKKETLVMATEENGNVDLLAKGRVVLNDFSRLRVTLVRTEVRHLLPLYPTLW
jgi:hypothetical protein